MYFNFVSSPTRSKSVQSKRIKHPAFDDSDSEGDTTMYKSVQFQLLHQEAEQQDLNTGPHSSTLSSESSPSSKLLHAIPTPFKRLHFPQHLLPHFHESKPQFLIVEPLPKLAPPLPPPPVPGSAIPVVPSAPISPPMSPPRERTRRYSLDEVLPDYADTTSRSKVSRRRRSFDFKEPLVNTNGQDALQQEPGPGPQESIPIPVFNHVSNLTDSTRAQDLPQSTLAPDTRDSFTTPFSPAILTRHVDPPPLGLLRFEKPNLELRTADLSPEPSGVWTPQRERPRKVSPRDVPIHEIKISAPASLNNATHFVDFQTTPPRTAPLPPSSDSSPSATRKNSSDPLTGSAIASEERPTGGSNSADLSQTDANRVTNEPARKVPRFSAVAKVAGRLLGHRSQTPWTPSPDVNRPSLPPLLYSASTPIDQHVLAISTRIKDEFKMKLRNEIELPDGDAATEEEFIQHLQDVNEDIRQCAKQLAKLLHRSSADKKESKAKKIFDIRGEVRTKLNSFLVTRVFQPFSIQLNEEDDKAVRDRYEEIAPSVPQFVASRWRVVASASTSHPIQELNPALANLAADASTLILRNYSPDAKCIKETKALLVPLIHHAYLLAHFNHLGMITTDYDIFCGTEIGASMIPSQEEEHLNGHSKTRDSRVSSYWSLGLRKTRYVGEGAFQRRVWDVLLKSQVLTSSVA